jgi:hypothetical protein
MWGDELCHRSKKSGLVRGVKKFILYNPETAIDYLHVACSGASAIDLFKRLQPSSRLGDNRTVAQTQFDFLRNELIGARGHDQIHLLIMSIGGNDVGFGEVVVNYVIEPRNIVAEDFLSDLESGINTSIESLESLYENIDAHINNDLGDKPPIVGICTYPNPTRGPWGRCGCSTTNILMCTV